MIRINEKLNILYDDNGSFFDFSKELSNFKRGEVTFTYTALEDSFYIGFKKPINTFFVQTSTANVNDVNMTLSYYNGSAFTEVVGFYDDSDALKRSGFVRWDRNQVSEAKTIINAVEKYWYKLDLSGDSSEIVLSGMNIVFSDDDDLKSELFEIDQYLPSGQSSHILTHAACRDEIIQDLNLLGKKKKNPNNKYFSNISAFDLLDTSEVKLAATYLALAKIMFNVSDQVDDAYLQKSQIYRSKYNDIINNMNIWIDFDDDGLRDDDERENQFYGEIKRA